MRWRNKPHWSFWILSPFLGFFIVFSLIVSVLCESWRVFFLFLPLNLFCVLAILITQFPLRHVWFNNFDRLFSSKLKWLRPIWLLCVALINFSSTFGEIKGRIEWDESGFYAKQRILPFHKERVVKEIKWTDVKEVYACMVDCFYCHLIAVGFVETNGKWFSVYEDIEHFDCFVSNLSKRFEGFNTHNFDLIKDCFPWEISLPCWNRDEEVDTLMVSNTFDKIVVLREKDKSVFISGEDK